MSEDYPRMALTGVDGLAVTFAPRLTEAANRRVRGFSVGMLQRLGVAAAGAGGVLRDIDAAYGSSSLVEVMRFTDPTEGQATLAVREGDPAAAGFYADLLGGSRLALGDVEPVADGGCGGAGSEHEISA